MRQFIAIMALAAMTACTSEESISDVNQPEEPTAPAYSVSIKASFEGNGTTRAVDLATNSETGKQYLASTFKTTENILVYDVTQGVIAQYVVNYIETSPTFLHPDRDGKSANLVGTLKFAKKSSDGYVDYYSYEEVKENDVMQLYYNMTSTDYNYSGQTGTLAGLSNYDFATATVTVTGVSGTNKAGYTLTTTEANFVNAQSMFRFTFTGLPEDVGVKSVTISSAGGKLCNNSVTISLDDAARSANGVGVVYAALRFDALGSGETDNINFTVVGTDGAKYKATKTSPTGGFQNSKYYTSTVALTSAAIVLSGNVDLSDLNIADGEEITIANGATIRGTLSKNVKLLIASGASVTLSDATINGIDNNNYMWAGLTCLGNANIILADGTTNTVKGFYQVYPGIEAGPAGTTLTISGSGSLTASSGGDYGMFGCGIGAGSNTSCGNITIEDGNITANGGNGAAGIGSSAVPINGTSVSCGNIAISGTATVNATGGYSAAGIGTGLGTDSQKSICGNITIGGTATVIATGNKGGIGSSWYSECGTVTIESTVTRVTASKTDGDGQIIGKGESNSTCGTVTIDGVAGATPKSSFPHFTSELSSDSKTWTLTH